MTDEQTIPMQPTDLPMAPGRIRDVAEEELQILAAYVGQLSVQQWKQPSAVAAWKIGDVVAHLNLTVGLYVRLVDAVLAGRGSGAIWRNLGKLSKDLLPATAPAVNALNSAIPRAIDRALAPEVIQGQFAAAARNFGERLARVGPGDFGRQVHYRGSPWPLSYFLTAITNELAIHRWDLQSPQDATSRLGPGARAVLPWFYWGGTSWMLQAPKNTNGRLQVCLADPACELWWNIIGGRDDHHGAGTVGNPDVTIEMDSSAFVLTLAGRNPQIGPATTVAGDATLSESFLRSWRLV